MQVNELRNKLEQEKGRRNQVEKDLVACSNRIEEKEKELHDHEKAREIIREVGLKTQSELSFHISDIVSLAMYGVFPNPYELEVDFVQRRNKTECDLSLERDGNKMDPMDATGGGVVDIASFALRCASWSMMIPRASPILILDEPFKHLSRGFMKSAGDMVREISDKLGLQIIMVSHEEELVDVGDKVFRSSIGKDGRSKVREE